MAKRQFQLSETEIGQLRQREQQTHCKFSFFFSKKSSLNFAKFANS
ncbi:hypothetical protein HYT59_01155 [Candidatus Woesebacteria bacterium]|nr:hypothetical protein [Candidatus Woesebacteria bacterium]